MKDWWNCLLGDWRVVLSLLVIFFSGGVLLGRVFDPQVILPEPEQCSLCATEGYTAPCLLDVVSGERSELTGSMVPGVFQLPVYAGLNGAWDSDKKTCRVGLPSLEGEINPRWVCASCRALLDGAIPGRYAILDLSEPECPRVYPVVVGATYHILGQTVLVTEEDGVVVLTMFPTTAPEETSPWAVEFHRAQ